MAVTQYIGARYVPLFADPIDWDINKGYEPLTIVYYQGNSYTSKQHVPSGTDITNTDYWALTGNYNAQIEAYREEVLQFLKRFPLKSEDVANGAITAPKIADGAVTSGKLADGAVASGNIANGAVASEKIADSAVTSGKIADGSVTLGKLASGLVSNEVMKDEKLNTGAAILKKIKELVYERRTKALCISTTRTFTYNSRTYTDSPNVFHANVTPDGGGLVSQNAIDGTITVTFDGVTKGPVAAGEPFVTCRSLVRSTPAGSSTLTIRNGITVYNAETGAVIGVWDVTWHDDGTLTISSSLVANRRFVISFTSNRLGMVGTIQNRLGRPDVRADVRARAIDWLTEKANNPVWDYADPDSDAPFFPNESGIVNCSGLVYAAFKHTGIEPAWNYSWQIPQCGDVLAVYEPNEPIDMDGLQPGDLICNYGTGNYSDRIRHVAIIKSVDDETMFEATVAYGTDRKMPVVSPISRTQNTKRVVVRYI